MGHLATATVALAWILGGAPGATAGAQAPDAATLCARAQTRLSGRDPAILRACDALRQNPGSIRDLNALGVAFARQKMYRDAVAAYKLALGIDPRASIVQKNLGLAYFKAGDYEAAIVPLRRAEKLDPEDSQSRVLLGMSYYGIQNYAAAATELAGAARAEPQNTRLLFVVAECYLWSHQPQKTLEIFRTIEERQPDSAAAAMLLGQALDGLKRYDQAIEEFQKAASAAPDAPNIHFVLGYLYWKERKFNLAAPEFELELRRNPANGEARAYLGDVRYREGNLTAARSLLARALAEGAHDRVIYLDLGIIDTVRKNDSMAIAELQKAVALDPSQTDAHYRLALAYRDAGNAAAAARELQTIKEMDEESRSVTQRQVLGTRAH